MNGLEFGFGICYGDAKTAEGNIWGSRWGSYPRGVNNRKKKEEKKRMKKFLSLCMAFMFVFCGIPAMNASASVVSTINPTDGYTITSIKTVTQEYLVNGLLYGLAELCYNLINLAIQAFDTYKQNINKL